MLPRANRLTDGAEYKAVVRRGARCSGPHTVTYVVASPSGDATRFGFIVSKQVGSAVTRNTVRRRLKAICAESVATVQPGTQIVVRALPNASRAGFDELQREVRRALNRRAV